MAKNLEEIRLKCEKSKKKEYNASIVQIDKATKGLKSFVCFSLEQDENSGQMVFTYKLKEKAIKERKNSYGKFVIITRRANLSNKEMLEYYPYFHFSRPRATLSFISSTTFKALSGS
jgi:ribosomal protein L30E